MAERRAQQPTLVDDPATRLPRIVCKDCKRPLTDPVSRQRRQGPECDPERRGGRTPRHDVEQEPLPGT